MKNHKIIFGVITGAFLVAAGFYFYIFHCGLSTLPDDWMAFGSFFSSIAAILNVIVFAWLTCEINSLNNREKERDRKHQESIIKTQMRYEELKWLINKLNQVTEGNPSFLKYGEISNTSLAINSFLQTRECLFPLLAEESAKRHFVDMCEILNKIARFHQLAAGINENGIPGSPNYNMTEEFKNAYKEFHTKRNELIQLLETFILNNIE